MKRGSGIVLGTVFLAAMSLPAVAQDPSDPVFDENAVATIGLTISAADWAAIRDNQQDTTWRRATFTWQGETLTDVAVRPSGGGIATPGSPWYQREKPSLRLKFDEFVLGRKWRGMSHLRLDAIGSWNMTARMGYWSHRQFGVLASRYANSRLYVNGEYRGCYGVEEMVRKAWVAYRLGPTEDGNLYKPETNAANNWQDAYLWRDWNPASYVPVPFDAITNETGGNYGDVPALLNVLNNASPASVRTELERIVNVSGMLSHLAVSASIGDTDSLWNWNTASRNHYVYHRTDNNLLEFIPWDTDGSFNYGSPTVNVWDPTPWSFSSAIRWIPGDAVAKAAFESKVRAFVAGPLSAASARVDFIYNQIQSHVAADPYSPSLNPTFQVASFAAEYQRMKDWIAQRLAYLRSQFPTTTLPTVTIVATDPNASEPSSTGFFTVTRTGSTSAALSVVRARSGTATTGVDFAALPSPIQIPAGQASVTVTVTPIDDTNVEGPETVTLTISPDPTYTVGAASTATVTIADNDTVPPPTLPTVTITASANAAEPSTAGSFTVTRTGSTTADLLVDRPRSGTATSGVDFAAMPNPIVIRAGQSSVIVPVTPIDDALVEGPETVILTLSSTATYTVGTASSATVTINDNDAAPLPAVTITASANAAEPSTAGSFTVTRTGPTTASLSVDRPRSGSAQSGVDFVAMPNPIVIPAGQASVVVPVTPIDDALVEGPETVILTLSSTANYTVGTASSATVTIADNDTVPPPTLPTVTITASANAAEPSTAGSFMVTRTGPTTADLSVARPRSGTATSGVDFASMPNPIVIPAGQASVVVPVTPIDDTLVEGPETVILTLSSTATYTVGAASSATVTIADDDTGSGGLSATYYDNQDFTGTSVTRTDPTVDFNWADQAPAPGIGPDTFSVRWTGRVRAQYTETYTFYTFTNDGVRLWVEGELLVDKWVQQSGGIEWSAQIALQAGRWYTVQVDYYEGMGNSVAQLLWSSPSIPKQVIPQSALDPALGAPDSRDNDGDGIPNDSDLDDDNDGIPDLQDPDRDGDTLTNLAEIASGSDPDDRNSPNAGGVPPVASNGDNDNGGGPFQINDKCGGSIGAARAPTWLLFILLGLTFLGMRRRDQP